MISGALSCPPQWDGERRPLPRHRSGDGSPQIIASLQDLEDDTFERHGLTATGTWDEVDDPVPDRPRRDAGRDVARGLTLPQPDDSPQLRVRKRLLQIELLKMQGWVKETGQRIVMVFEGRDAAGKGGTIKRFMEHMNPRGARVIALEKPSEREAGQWYFQRYIRHLPTKGEIVMFDRSWYNRAGVERVMGFCSDEDYAQFMRQTPEFEKMLVRDGIILISSGSRSPARNRSPVSPSVASIPCGNGNSARWTSPASTAGTNTAAKEAMFWYTDTDFAPWTVVRSNDKKRGRLEAMRWVLNRVDYPTRTSMSSAPRTR